MHIFLTIVAFIVIFSVIVLLHELGHYLMAKRAGIKVEEFGMGLPPRIWGKKVGETIYSINWIPFGGFVRMLGEDSTDPSMVKKKRSFASMPARSRIFVVIAGVVMNFLLAWVLLTVGYSVGMQPLLMPQDVLGAVEDGLIIVQTGENDDGYNVVSFPRVSLHEVPMESSYYKSGLRNEDVILSIEGSEIFNVEMFDEAVEKGNVLDFVVYRDDVELNVIVDLPSSYGVIVSAVLDDTPAMNAGIKEGDVILSVDGEKFDKITDLIDFVMINGNEPLAYLVQRDTRMFSYEVQPVDGKIGVMLSELVSYGGDARVSVFNTDVPTSVIEIKDEQYPVHVAAYKGAAEMYKMGKMTTVMFVDFVSGFFTTGSVPDSVAGPVGIAQMTSVFVEEGFISLLRFMAILSLSLGVINILPFPALDGGRLLFIIIELIIGRRVNPKWESIIHMIGYGLILLLILAVTYSDILRLFGM